MIGMVQKKYRRQSDLVGKRQNRDYVFAVNVQNDDVMLAGNSSKCTNPVKSVTDHLIELDNTSTAALHGVRYVPGNVATVLSQNQRIDSISIRVDPAADHSREPAYCKLSTDMQHLFERVLSKGFSGGLAWGDPASHRI